MLYLFLAKVSDNMPQEEEVSSIRATVHLRAIRQERHWQRERVDFEAFYWSADYRTERLWDHKVYILLYWSADYRTKWPWDHKVYILRSVDYRTEGHWHWEWAS